LDQLLTPLFCSGSPVIARNMKTSGKLEGLSASLILPEASPFNTRSSHNIAIRPAAPRKDRSSLVWGSKQNADKAGRHLIASRKEEDFDDDYDLPDSNSEVSDGDSDLSADIPTAVAALTPVKRSKTKCTCDNCLSGAQGCLLG
jgi:hypothetical protein